MSKWWHPSKPDEIKPIPWLAPRVIAHLESILTPDMEVIEHGSGGSTLWFAERVKSVTAYEHKDEWFNEIAGIRDNIFVYDNSETILPPACSHFYDLLLIDGEPIQDREDWILAAPDLVRPGGWVVLDNANRPEYAAERKWLQGVCESYETFDCNEGTSYLVTEFYKMKG